MHLCFGKEEEEPCDASTQKRRMLVTKSGVNPYFPHDVGKLETLQTHEEKYDPFKNSQIVLFVYITQGATHAACGVRKGESFTTNAMKLFNQ